MLLLNPSNFTIACSLNCLLTNTQLTGFVLSKQTGCQCVFVCCSILHCVVSTVCLFLLHLQSRQGHDLLSCTQQMADKIKTKWTNPEVSANPCMLITSQVLAQVLQWWLFLESSSQKICPQLFSFSNDLEPTLIK